MALHKSTAKATSTLARLRASQASLELRAKQLAARKSEVESKADRLSRSLKRTIDTREKIVLGALVKMVQLDRFTLGQPNQNQMTAISERNGNVVTMYDLDLIVGALLSISEQLNDNDTSAMDELRIRGKAFRSLSKNERIEHYSPLVS